MHYSFPFVEEFVVNVLLFVISYNLSQLTGPTLKRQAASTNPSRDLRHDRKTEAPRLLARPFVEQRRDLVPVKARNFVKLYLGSLVGL
jgi:hypothetical protein